MFKFTYALVKLLLVRLLFGTLLMGAEKPFEIQSLFRKGDDTIIFELLSVSPKPERFGFRRGSRGWRQGRHRSHNAAIDRWRQNVGDIEVLWDDSDNTCGNPCPVVDLDTGTVAFSDMEFRKR